MKTIHAARRPLAYGLHHERSLARLETYEELVRRLRVGGGHRHADIRLGAVTGRTGFAAAGDDD
jgi:hypothetical protein